jgi:protein SCO1/2
MPDTATSGPPAGLRRVRLVIWASVAVAAVALAWLLLRPSPQGIQLQSTPTGIALGGPFTLTGADGRPFSSAQLAGKPYAMFFGFTHCPDVCPTTLARLASLRQRLGQDEDAFRIVFVSVDPERDTPEAVGAYAKLFNTPIIGLTGSRAQIDQVARQHAIYQAKAADAEAPDGYTVDHGATVLLFDRAGKFVATIAPEEGDPAALDKLKRITA